MRLLTKLLTAVLVCLGGVSLEAAHTQATLVLAAETARPGDTVMAGVLLRMDKGWHTYWKNAGASGMPTTIEWQLPAGLKAGEIDWPVPEKLPDEELTTYIYKGEVLLSVPLTLSADLKPGSLTLKAKVSWLECEVSCIPGQTELERLLTIGTETKASKSASLLETWRKKLPGPGAALSARAWWEKGPNKDVRPLIVQWISGEAINQPDFYPYGSEDYEVQGQTERLPADAGKVQIRKLVKKLAGDWPKEVSGLLVQEVDANRRAFEVKLPVEAKGSEAAAPTGKDAGTPGNSGLEGANPLQISLWKMLVYAFIGGLILNVMPCVLPVIALKILGFVGQAKQDPRRARRLGLVYGAGVLVSFLGLAALVLIVKAAGHKAGWGIQFGNPYFLIAMTTLATLIALNLFGVFEVQLGGTAMGAATELSSKEGAAGAFFNGLLATVLATSCTAPFLGAAVGFAFAPSQTAPVTLLVFVMIGIGLALPYVILSWKPGWLKFLPKPGAWMERFKVAMGFPMLAAAVWLYSLVSLHYGDRSWWLAVFLVMIAVAAWIYGEFIQRQTRRKWLAGVAMLGVLATSYVFALEGHLRWREPVSVGDGGIQSGNTPDGVNWEAWSTEAVAKARAEARPVLVDFTAKWCLTCNTIIKPALESASVRQKLKDINAVSLLGDYTGFSDKITEELNRFGRAGVPLVLVYPKQASKPPIVLPEALTPGMVLAALDQAAR